MANNRDNENATLENVRIVFRNFAGAEGRFNAKGDRNFGVILPEDVAQQMIKDGWNVKYLQPRSEEDEPQAWMQVKINYNGRPPRVVLISSRGRTNLGEDQIAMLDWAEIKNVDMILRPYHWNVSGKSGVKAYLQSLYVTIEEDELELKYNDVPDSARSALTQDPYSE